MQAHFVARSMCNGEAMKGLWPADFEKPEEEPGEGRHWTDHEDAGWKAGSDGFETVADRMVEKLGLEGDEEISWGGACRKVEVFTKEIGSKDTSIEEWEKRIQETTMAGDYDVEFTNGSKLENGKTGAG